jgi:hypothetical protein
MDLLDQGALEGLLVAPSARPLLRGARQQRTSGGAITGQQEHGKN